MISPANPAGLRTASDAVVPETPVSGVQDRTDVLPGEVSLAVEAAGGVALEAYLEEHGAPPEIAAGNASFW